MPDQPFISYKKTKKMPLPPKIGDILKFTDDTSTYWSVFKDNPYFIVKDIATSVITGQVEKFKPISIDTKRKIGGFNFDYFEKVNLPKPNILNIRLGDQLIDGERLKIIVTQIDFPNNKITTQKQNQDVITKLFIRARDNGELPSLSFWPTDDIITRFAHSRENIPHPQKDRSNMAKIPDSTLKFIADPRTIMIVGKPRSLYQAHNESLFPVNRSELPRNLDKINEDDSIIHSGNVFVNLRPAKPEDYTDLMIAHLTESFASNFISYAQDVKRNEKLQKRAHRKFAKLQGKSTDLAKSMLIDANYNPPGRLHHSTSGGSPLVGIALLAGMVIYFFPEVSEWFTSSLSPVLNDISASLRDMIKDLLGV